MGGGGGYRTITARYAAKWGIAQMCLCETKHQEGASHHFGGVPTSLKTYHAIRYRSDTIARSRDMGTLSQNKRVPKRLASNIQKLVILKPILFDTPLGCNGQSVGQPRKRECRQNARRMPKKMSENCPEGLKDDLRTFF